VLRKDTPCFVEPCVPTSANAPPTGEQWQHEPKFDGWRCQAVKTGGTVRLFARHGQDITDGCPALVEMLAELPANRLVLDGELISSNAHGVPDFAALTRALRNDPRALIFATFDCLHLEGHDLKSLALDRRRRVLVHLIVNSQVPVMVIPAFDDGALLLSECGRAGLEGVVSKRRDLPYRSGLRPEWVKVKYSTWVEAKKDRREMFKRLA
jgi:ATP-dependent DNA ligase